MTLIDSTNRCLWAMPERASEHAEKYMQDAGVITEYNVKYDPENASFWERVKLKQRADATYVMNAVSARSSFMPPKTLSLKGPGGGNWIVTNSRMQVCVRDSTDKATHVWASGRIFAVGDCHFGAVESGKRSSSDRFTIPPVPKSVFAAQAWAGVACRNIVALSRSLPLEDATWPCQAGSMALTLGPDDGIVALKVPWAPSASENAEVVMVGEAAADMKRQLLQV